MEKALINSYQKIHSDFVIMLIQLCREGGQITMHGTVVSRAILRTEVWIDEYTCWIWIMDYCNYVLSNKGIVGIHKL